MSSPQDPPQVQVKYKQMPNRHKGRRLLRGLRLVSDFLIDYFNGIDHVTRVAGPGLLKSRVFARPEQPAPGLGRLGELVTYDLAKKRCSVVGGYVERRVIEP